MAKHYDLVGSVYDKYARGNKYKEEEIIKIPGLTFNSLEDIDKFTATLTGSFDLSNHLDSKYQRKNHFSIRVTTNENYYYKSIIYNNPDLVEIISSLSKNVIYTPRGYRTVKLYNGNNSLFTDAWFDVEDKIIKKDSEWLARVFGENNSYNLLINRYINGDIFENNNLLLELQDAFREYEVFRKYLTDKDKAKSRASNIKVNSFKTSSKTSFNVIKEKLGSTNYISLDDEFALEEDDYEPDDFAFFSPEERLKAYGEGNEDIEEHRRKRKW